MWIVYISIGLMVIAIGMLAVSLMKTVKTTRPVINEMNHTVASIQSSMDEISSETTQLQETQGEIQGDIEYKKTAINHMVQEARRTPEIMKEFVKNMKK